MPKPVFVMIEVILIAILVALNLMTDIAWLQYLTLVLVLSIALFALYAICFGAPFVPTSRQRLEKIITLGDFGPGDFVVELGCGDGRVMRRIWQEGVSAAVGIEFSPPNYFYALFKKFLSGTQEKIVLGDMWKQDYSSYNKLVCYLMDKPMQRFEKEIWPGLKKGTYVVVNQFPMPNVEPVKADGGVYLYIKQ